ncbi:MAG: STAS domain-containing protein [Leptospirales bacterium]|jgi:anti-sigma B factor antagonist
MEMEIKDKGRHKVIALSGELDLYNVGKLKKQIQPLLKEDVSSLVIDLTNLKYMDSSGIALMAHCRKKMLEKSGEFALMGVGQDIINVLRLAALEQFFTFIESEDKLD